MDFKDTIQQLADKIAKQKDCIATEEATKNSFIMLMIAALGYDVFNPFEVVPEMDCDLTKKGDKIDYAIMKDEQPVLLIECKHCKQNLNLHSTQLSKYYAASNARFGVLTNGIEYRFYADLNKTNIMDENPFLVINMLDLSDVDIEQLKKFHKSYYNENEILSTAQELQITIQIKDILAANFQSPGDEFARYFVKCINEGKSLQKLIELYKPILKKSIISIINETIQERLNLASKGDETHELDTNLIMGATEEPNKLPDGVVSMDSESGVITTQEEIDAYNIIRSILRKYISADRVIYQDSKSYFIVALETKYWWVCRLAFGSRKKSIYFPTEGYKEQERVELENLDDIFKYADRLEQAFLIANQSMEQYKLKHQK